MDKTVLIIEMLFPPHCLFCGELKPFRQECPGCVEIEKKHRITGEDRLNYQMDERASENLSGVISSYVYTEETGNVISRYKFRRNYTMAREMAKIMAVDVMELLGKDCCDVVLSVPAQKKRTNRHSELIASRMAKTLSKPHISGVLVKTKDTEPQHDLSFEERAQNLKGAFSVLGDSVKGKRVLLCDDVMTSGNTLNECAKALLEAGAVKVMAATFSATSSKTVKTNPDGSDKPDKGTAKKRGRPPGKSKGKKAKTSSAKGKTEGQSKKSKAKEE